MGGCTGHMAGMAASPIHDEMVHSTSEGAHTAQGRGAGHGRRLAPILMVARSLAQHLPFLPTQLALLPPNISCRSAQGENGARYHPVNGAMAILTSHCADTVSSAASRPALSPSPFPCPSLPPSLFLPPSPSHSASSSCSAGLFPNTLAELPWYTGSARCPTRMPITYAPHMPTYALWIHRHLLAEILLPATIHRPRTGHSQAIAMSPHEPAMADWQL